MRARVRLGGIDVFHLVNHRHMRARGLVGNHCAHVLVLDGRLDVGRLEARLGRAVQEVPELGWRLQNGFARSPGWSRGPLRSPVVTMCASDEPVFDVAAARLAEPLGAARPWAMDVLRGPVHDAVMLRWFHPLCDAKAGERLFAWLGSSEADRIEVPAAEERWDTSDRRLEPFDLRGRVELARAYTAHVTRLGEVPILSLASRVHRRRPGAMKALRLTLSENETRRFDERVRHRAKLAETSVMLLAALRAMDDTMRARSLAPPRYVVPLPLSLDPKVGARRLLGNNLTMLLLSLDRVTLRDEPLALAQLADQQRAMVREKLDVAMLAGLSLVRHLPRLAYRWVLTHPFRGEMSSLVISNPGGLSTTTFAGLPVIDAFSLATPVSPPGIQVVFTRFAGQLTTVVLYLQGVLSELEASTMVERLRQELLE